MKAKKRITAIITTLAMILTVQPLCAGTAVAAVAIQAGENTFTSDNTEYTLEDVTNCSGINISGTGNSLKVSGTNTVAGSVGSDLKIKPTKAKWGSTMLSATSLVGSTSVDLSGLSFSNLINFISEGSPESPKTDLISVGSGSVTSITGATGALHDQSSIVVPGEDTTTNGVKIYSELRGKLSADASGRTLSVIGGGVTPKCSSANNYGIDISNWNPAVGADTLTGWSRPDDTYSVYGVLPAFTEVRETKTILSSNTSEFFNGKAKIDSSIAYGAPHSFNIKLTDGVEVSGTHTGGVRVSADGKSLEYVPGTVTVSKITFTNVDWKDSGALIDHSSVWSGVSFDGVDVDTSNICFKNKADAETGSVMTLISGFGNSVGTITGSMYALSNNKKGEGRASLENVNLIYSLTGAPISESPSVISGDQQKPGTSNNWNEVKQEITEALVGGTIRVDAKDSPVIPSDVVEAAKGKDVNVAMDMGDGVQVDFNGKDVTGSTGDVDMGVKMNTNSIPQTAIDDVGKGKQATQIEFGNGGAISPVITKLKVTLPVPTELRVNPFANMFQYLYNKRVETGSISGMRGALRKEDKKESDQGTLKFISSGAVTDDGKVSLVIESEALATGDTATNKFVIIYDDHRYDPNTSKHKPEELTLKSKTKKGKILLSWNKLNDAKKYCVYQKIGKKYKTISTSKKTSLTVNKAYLKTKKNGKSVFKLKKLSKNKKYVFVVKAYVNGKWTKSTTLSTKTVKMK